MTKEAMIAAFLRTCSTLAEARFAAGLIAECEVLGYAAGAVSLMPADPESCLVFELRSQVALMPDTRSDFAVFYPVPSSVPSRRLIALIEVDDPSHWSSEAKAAADRRRDLDALASLGVPTLRVTNREASLPDVAQTILRALESLQSARVDMYQAGRKAALEDVSHPAESIQ